MNEVNYELQRIARGAGIVFIGTVVSMFLGFLNRTIIARYFSTREYGVFSLVMTILNIALVIATFGFPDSLPREVAFYKEREPSRIDSIISTALAIILLASLAVTTFLIFESTYIAQVFNEKSLVYALKVVSLALPFSALTGLFIGISRGFGRVREKVYYQNLLFPLLWFLLLGTGVLLKMEFYYALETYVTAQIITFSVLVMDLFRLRLLKLGPIDLKVGKKLIQVSMPLMLSGILWFVMNWIDTLMLGYYMTSDIVGLYNAASPLARLLLLLLNSVGFLYTPIATRFYAQGKINEMKIIYQILTKWTLLLTIPIFSLMFLFPEAIIKFFFGKKYLSASQALRILDLGLMAPVLLGLNGLSLIVIGENNFIVVWSLGSAAFNAVLNEALIPIYGLNGAAVATAISHIIGNILGSLRLYQKTKIHPFSRNYLKIIGISFVLIGLSQNLHLRITNIQYVIPILIIFLGVYFLLILLSGSVEKEDLELLSEIERKLGVNLKITKILERFV